MAEDNTTVAPKGEAEGAEKKEEVVVEEKKADTDKPEAEEISAQSGSASGGDTGKFAELVEQIEKMSVLDLSELVKVLEKKFGVSAASFATATPVAGGGDTEGEEQSTFDVELKDIGAQKIQVIKVVREATGLGLKESKDIVDAAPKIIKEGLSKKDADELKNKLMEAGATADLK